MMRHVLLFSLTPSTGEDDRQALLDDLAALPIRYPKMRDFQIGRNVSDRDDRFAYGMTFYFDEKAELNAYLTSEFHERFVRERFQPLLAERSIVTFVVQGRR